MIAINNFLSFDKLYIQNYSLCIHRNGYIAKLPNTELDLFTYL